MDQGHQKEIRTVEVAGLVIPVLGDYDEKSLDQIRSCVQDMPQEGARAAALMADHHPGHGIPVGGVLASEFWIAPEAVGVDIACGNMAVKTNKKFDDIRDDLPRIMDEIFSRISFGVGRNNLEPVDHPVLEKIRRSEFGGVMVRKRDRRTLAEMAAEQLGTVGSGNHYVDLLIDTGTHDVWVGVHFGSRGFGHTVCSGFENIARGGTFLERPDARADGHVKYLDVRTPSGQSYIENMQLAGEYAYAGRELVVERVCSILGATQQDVVHNHHNFAWLEPHKHLGYVWVTRKGATPAWPNQRGFVGGSMLDNSVILRGEPLPTDLADAFLHSTVHGAGRVMSRTQATGVNKRGKRIAEPLVDFAYWSRHLRDIGIELRGAGADEAPPNYRRLLEVLEAQRPTVYMETLLRPVGVAMAGPDIFDPYKD